MPARQGRCGVTNKLTIDDLRSIIQDVSCGDIGFRLMVKGDGFLVQAQAERPDADSKPDPETGLHETKLQRGRKWYVSPYSAFSEVVETLYSAALRFELHELRERFKFRSEAIYSPHLDVRDLAAGIELGRIELDCREGE